MPDPSSPSSGPRVDQVLAGRYRLIRPIAAGGMAQVWEADDAVLSRPVAVKVLHPHLASDASFVARFRAEAISAARLTHPGIVSIYDTWSGPGTEAIVMELVRGTTLRHLLDARGALPPDEALTIADHIAAALDAAHRAGIVHRDIKPANVLLSADGRVLVTDFGIAKAVEGSDLTAERTMLGTAKYLAPEQVEGAPVDGRSDLYALGVVLYEMLAGEVPFRAESETATALARLHRHPDPPSTHRPGLAPSLDALVLRCLARSPADRPASAAELRHLLAAADRRFDGTAPGRALPTPAPAPVAGPPLPSAAPLTSATPSPSAPPTVAPPTGPPAAPPTPPASSPPEHRARTGGRWLAVGLVVVALVVGAVLVVALVGGDRGDGALPLAGAAAFDPLGRPPGEEHNADAPLAVDGDPSSAWSTERYHDPDRLGKAGVGLVVRLAHPARLADLVVDSPSANWSATVYLATGEPGQTLAAWGQPASNGQAIAVGRNRFPLGGRVADTVLIWITRVGDDGTVRLRDVVVDGR